MKNNKQRMLLILGKLWPFNTFYDQCGATGEQRRTMNIFAFAPLLFTVFAVASGGAIFNKFAAKLGMDTFEFGILNSVNSVIAVFGLVAAWVLGRTRKRRAMMIYPLIASRLIWLVIALIPFIIPQGAQLMRIWIFIILLSSISLLNTFSNIASQSWFADAIPLTIRGRYLATRGSFMNIATLVISLVMSFAIQMMKDTILAYSIAIAIGVVFGLADILLYFFCKDTPMKPVAEQNLFKGIVTCLKDKGFLVFVMFWGLWAFGCALGASFYGFYLSKSYEIPVSLLTIGTQVIPSLVVAATFPYWGKLLDKHGRKWVLIRSIVASVLTVLLWIPFGQNAIWLMFVFFGLEAIMGGGVGLVSQHMIYSAIPEQNRALYIAVFSVINTAVFSALGNLIGGALINVMSGIQFTFLGFQMDGYKIMFLVSALFRLTSSLVLMRGIGRLKDHD